MWLLYLDGTLIGVPGSDQTTQKIDLPRKTLLPISLILDSLSIDYIDPTHLALYGTGTLYGAGFEPTAGEWIAGFTTSGGQEATFSWASLTGSTGEPGQSVPDGGSTAMLLGCGLVLVGVLNRSRR